LEFCLASSVGKIETGRCTSLDIKCATETGSSNADVAAGWLEEDVAGGIEAQAIGAVCDVVDEE